MNSTPTHRTLRFAILACFASLSLFSAVVADDDKVLFESLKIGNSTVKNVRLAKETPVEIIIMYDGGGSTLKRQNLTGPLKDLFPYDTKKAEKYMKQQEVERQKSAQENKVRQEQLNRELKAQLLRQRETLKGSLAEVEKQLKQNDKDRAMARAKARGKGPRSPAVAELNRLRDEWSILDKRRTGLLDETDRINKSLDRLP